MSNSAAPTNFDFRRPRQLADDVERELSAWQSSLATLIVDRWEEQLGVRLAWKPAPLDNSRRAAIAERLGEDHACYALQFEANGGSFWFAMPRRLVLAVMALMLGEDVTELPEDRRLTDVEVSLMELAITELSRVMTDSQPVPAPLVCEFLGIRRPSDVGREFPEQDPIVVMEFNLEASFGGAPCFFLIQQETLLKFMNHVGEYRQSVAGGAGGLERVVTQIPMQVVVRLGGTKIHVSELLNLQPGDVVVLDQRVSEPLQAHVGTTTIFRGWPGRVGTRQAFQVDQVVVRGAG